MQAAPPLASGKPSEDTAMRTRLPDEEMPPRPGAQVQRLRLVVLIARQRCCGRQHLSIRQAADMPLRQITWQSSDPARARAGPKTRHEAL